jgi:phosphoribosyl-ATP pyrophosphohydrolase
MVNELRLAKLWEVIQSRRDDTTGYVGEFLQNPFKLRHKFIQEAYEVLEAHQARMTRLETNVPEDAEGQTSFGARRHVAAEAVDVLIHLYILLASIDVTPDDVHAVLEQRHARWDAQAAAGAAQPAGD